MRRLSLIWLALGVLPAPWFFGAWERWWFWPFTFCLFASGFCLALHWALRAWAGASLTGDVLDPGHLRRLLPVALSFLPFLAYAVVRAILTPVVLDAERSVLLFLTPFLAGSIIVFGSKKSEQRLLLLLLAINLALLGIYGVANHLFADSRTVMWAPQYPQYAGRATGSYHCPDHFSGIMELAFCLGLGYILSRRTEWSVRIPAALLCALAVVGVGMSKSRGGGLTLIVIALAAVVWGLSQYQNEQSWWNRISVVTSLIIVVLVLWNSNIPYMQRFKAYFPFGDNSMPMTQRIEILTQRLRTTSRGQMYSAAQRSWRTAPVWGIGAGMHRNVWPRFAASPDADRESGIPPSRWNDAFHSYEVHSDWLQLAQEYGTVGLVLFLVPMWFVFSCLRGALRRERLWWRRPQSRTHSTHNHAVVLVGLLCGIALTFHSFGDFNLQLPATVWLLASLMAFALAAAARQESPHGTSDVIRGYARHQEETATVADRGGAHPGAAS